MDAELKAVLVALVDHVELLRAHSLYQGELLSRLGLQVSLAEARDGVRLAMKTNEHTYSGLRQKIEAL